VGGVDRLRYHGVMTLGIQPQETECLLAMTSLEWPKLPRFPMNTISSGLMNELSEARRQVESDCQSLVDAGTAQWRVNDDGNTELQMQSGEAYLFGDQGVTRLK
jgi:hypothetical protein